MVKIKLPKNCGGKELLGALENAFSGLKERGYVVMETPKERYTSGSLKLETYSNTLIAETVKRLDKDLLKRRVSFSISEISVDDNYDSIDIVVYIATGLSSKPYKNIPWFFWSRIDIYNKYFGKYCKTDFDKLVETLYEEIGQAS